MGGALSPSPLKVVGMVAEGATPGPPLARRSPASTAFRDLADPSRVRVSRPFEPHDFFLGRIGVDARGRNDSHRVVLAAASGCDERSVRRRTVGELAERLSAIAGMSGHRHLNAPTRSERDTRAIGAIAANDDPTNDEERQCCPGEDLLSGATTWIPSRLIHLAGPADAVRRPLADSSGLAAHHVFSLAVRHGVTEVVERDAATLSWLVPGWPVQAVLSPPVPAAVRNVCAELRLRTWCFDVGEALPVALVILAEGDGSHLTIGTACGSQFDQGLVRRAAAEALMLQWTCRFSGEAQRLRLTKSTWISQPRTSLEHVLRAFEGGADVIDWYSRQSRGLRRLPHRPAVRTLRSLLTYMNQVFHVPAYVTPLAPPAWREAGWHAIRISISGALHKYNAQDMSPRLMAMLAACNAAPSQLNRRPHPFG